MARVGPQRHREIYIYIYIYTHTHIRHISFTATVKYLEEEECLLV